MSFRAKIEQLKTLKVFLPQSQGQNMAVTVLHVPHSRDASRVSAAATWNRFHPRLLSSE